MLLSSSSYIITLVGLATCVAELRPLHARGTAWSDHLTIDTLQGPITGHQAPNTSSVIEFLGIPYAKPPLGDLRFAPPNPYTGNEPYVASKFGFDCPSTPAPPSKFPGLTPQAHRVIAAFANGDGTAQSEDCLTLNIWSKVTTRADVLKAVLVFAYGGRFAIGTSNTPFYNGQYFADAQDVIIVTFNYRTNIFGFPGAPGIVQNLGLRDHRLAIEWIRDNIVNFGGDRRRITFFGQSAGGVAADWWSYAYESDPIVSGLISQSGNAFSFPLNRLDVTIQNWYNVSASLGCGGSGNTLACMRQQNWSAIEAASAKVKPSSGGSPLRTIPAFYPMIDDDVVFSDYENRSRTGQFAKIPYLLGSNDHEQGYYALLAFANGFNVSDVEGEQFLLESFTCPNSIQAKNRYNGGVPVWFYRYFGDWDNIGLYPTSGAYHGSDLEMIFGASQDVSGISSSVDESETTQTMQKAWAAFARKPNSGLTDVLGWPQFNPTANTLVRLAYNNNPVPDFVPPSMYDTPCSAITAGALATTSGS